MLEGFTRVPYKELGGYVSCMAPERLPLGSAVSAKNVKFFPNSVRPREGLTQVFQVPSNQSIRGLGELILQTSANTFIPLVYGSDGVLYKEAVIGSGALQVISDGLTADAFVGVSAAYGRAYLAFSNRITGLADVKQYYKYNGEFRLRGLSPAANAFQSTGSQYDVFGDAIPGLRYGVAFFEMETGYRTGFTEAAVFPLTVTEEDKQIIVSAVPEGPIGTIRRWVAFTAAGASSAGPFYIVEQDVTLQEANATFTKTSIEGNVTATAVFNFTDDFLQASTDVTKFFNKMQVPQAGGAKFMPSLRRIAYWGMADAPTTVYLSDPDDPETIYPVDSVLQVAEENGQRVQVPFEFRNTAYVAKERSGHSLSPNDDVPASWTITELWNEVGPCGPEALDVCDEFVVFASRKGLYKFDGSGGPEWISWEHGTSQGLWAQINWNYSQLISVTIDPETKRIFVCVPLGQSTECSHVLTCDYNNGFAQPVIANPQNGVLMTIRGRRWSVDNVASNKILRVERPLQASPNPNNPEDNNLTQSQLLIASSADDGAVNMFDPSSAVDNGHQINSEYSPAFMSPGGIISLGAVTVDLKGNGSVLVSSLSGSITEKQLNPILVTSTAAEKTVRTRGDSDMWSVVFRPQSPGDWFEIGSIALWLRSKWDTQVEGR